ncbi:hypothetical protein MPER_02840 [Moniliophthora perniciosa FA553]|nr:hypothetical protein MPER_02840 [Moniliophthora perniciosa FA553]
MNRFFQSTSVCHRRLDLHSAKKRGMPPKKATGAEKKTLLGRPGNNLKIGIVGLPNVGKSSFFNALSNTSLGVAANYPYATINPEVLAQIRMNIHFSIKRHK